MYSLRANKDGKLVAYKPSSVVVDIRTGDVLRATEDFCGFKLGEYYIATKLQDRPNQAVYIPSERKLVSINSDWVTSGKLEVYLKSECGAVFSYTSPEEEYEVQAGDVLYDKDTVAPFIVLNKSDKYNGYDLYNVRENERQSIHSLYMKSRFLLEDTPWYRKEPSQ